MKHLKAYKIFEAVESQILTKTIGYMRGSSENDIGEILKFIKKICSSIDFPFSKLTDEYFEYLPFKKALEKADMTGDDPCTGTSRQEFPQHAVEGASCQGGKILRKWGTRTREVVCTRCNGTGVEPKKSELKLIKLWFNKDGKFIAKTAVDGVSRTYKIDKFSKKSSDYHIKASLSDEEVQNLRTGQTIKANLGASRNVIAMIYNSGGRIYAIQDTSSGSEPGGRDWKKYGRYSWQMSRGEYSNVHLLEPKSLDDDKVEADPFEWNVGIRVRYGSSNIEVDPTQDVKELIKDAHFAIILDFGKLKKSGFETRSDISDTRKELISGSKLDPSESDEEIRNRNIERYMKTLSDRLDISSDISNVNKLVLRTIGYKNALFMILSNDLNRIYSNIITNYYELMEEGEEEKEYNLEKLKRGIDSSIKSASVNSTRISNTLSNVKTKLKEKGFSENPEKQLEIIKELESLSELVFEKIKNIQVDCIEDFEVISSLVLSIKTLFKSDRYYTGRVNSYVIDYLTRGAEERTLSYLKSSYYIDCERTLKDLKTVRKIIERM